MINVPFVAGETQDEPVAPIESPSNSQQSFSLRVPFSPSSIASNRLTPNSPRGGVLFTPHPLKLVTIAGFEKNLLQRSPPPPPEKKPIHH